MKQERLRGRESIRQRRVCVCAPRPRFCLLLLLLRLRLLLHQQVADNGKGVPPEDHAALALKYHTSKINQFNDLEVRWLVLCVLCCCAVVALD